MILQLKSLDKHYRHTHAINSVTADFNKGFYGLLGENGAGKSTLMRCIMGMEKYSGEIVLQDTRKSIGYLPQDFKVFENLTVRENMTFISQYKGGGDTIDSLLETVNLLDKKDAKAGELSGGMLKRLGIAQAMLGNPRVLLLDEPTSGLDPEERMRVCNYILEISGDKCVIMSTHIVRDAEELCDNLIVMHKGRLKYLGKTNELAETAAGKVYVMPYQEAEKQNVQSGIVKKYKENNSVRVLTNKACTGESVDPTTEDGYLCLLRDI